MTEIVVSPPLIDGDHYSKLDAHPGETVIIPASPGKTELRVTPESIVTMSRVDFARALHHLSGVSIDPQDLGSRPQKTRPNILAMLWRRLDDCVRRQVNGPGFRSDTLHPIPERRCTVCGKSASFGCGVFLRSGHEGAWYRMEHRL
jgi:hypothetical protein